MVYEYEQILHSFGNGSTGLLLCLMLKCKSLTESFLGRMSVKLISRFDADNLGSLSHISPFALHEL